MITNAREYQITKAQCTKLATALQSMGARGASDSLLMADIERQAIESEVALLTKQLTDYDDLYEGRRTHLEVQGLKQLPSVLIKARIASRMTQKELAVRLGVHMQQVQRYEATSYRAASFERMLEVAQMLGVKIRQDVVLAEPLVRKATNALKEWGLSRDFLVSRGIVTGSAESDEAIDSIASFDKLQHIFGWSSADLEAQAQLNVSPTAMGQPHFKLPSGRKQDYLRAYTAYAFRIACGAAKCARDLPVCRIPTKWQEAREQLLRFGPLTLKTVIDWAWSLGIVVVPLRDRAAFSGAFWRVDGRNVVILKQRTASVDRAMHDALHEVFHASQEAELRARSVIDAADTMVITSDPEEEEANMFASNVLLGGRANELAIEVAELARNQGPLLKSATSKVALRHGVSEGALANHLAWILQQQEPPVDWWGVAHNLQHAEDRPLDYANSVAFARLMPPGAPDIDAELLFNALRLEAA